MGYIVEITEDKVGKVSDHIEKALKHMGKAMQCVEDWMSENDMGERYMGERGSYGQGGSSGSYGNRSNSGNGGRSYYGNRMDDDDDEEMGERRGRRRYR